MTTIRDQLSRWLTIQHRRRLADRQLRALDPAARRRLVCEAMFHLNHYALRHKRTRFADSIYLLKNQLVEHLYKAGHCLSVGLHHQQLPCYCGGDPWCEKCDGTGIYREFDLYYFKFDVHGQIFVWHQPAEYVTWNPRLTFGESRIYEDRTVGGPPDGFNHNYAFQLVNVYLRWYQMPGVPGRSLSAIVRAAIMTAAWPLRRRMLELRYRLQPIVRRLHGIRPAEPIGLIDMNEDIPF